MVAPIVGKFRRNLLRDIGVSLTLGLGGGYYFWYAYHVPNLKKRDNYYAQLEASKA